jgi:ABC-type glycerol-3-phosphate transport system permease component
MPKTGVRAIQAIALNGFLIVVSLLVLVPVFLMVSTALKAPGETTLNPGLIPREIDFTKFATVFRDAEVPLLARNSVIITIATVLLLLFLASLTAYAFARLDFVLKEVLYFVFLAGLMIPGAAVIVPLYQLAVRYGLMNTYASLVGPYVALGMPFAILILRGFFEGLPVELEDAALIDGASRFMIYWRILLPLTKPALVTVGIFQGLASWNDFLLPMLFLTDVNMRTLPLGVIAFQYMYYVQHEHRFALIVMMTLPVFILFLLAQKQFMAGLTAGAVKG